MGRLIPAGCDSCSTCSNGLLCRFMSLISHRSSIRFWNNDSPGDGSKGIKRKWWWARWKRLALPSLVPAVASPVLCTTNRLPDKIYTTCNKYKYIHVWRLNVANGKNSVPGISRLKNEADLSNLVCVALFFLFWFLSPTLLSWLLRIIYLQAVTNQATCGAGKSPVQFAAEGRFSALPRRWDYEAAATRTDPKSRPKREKKKEKGCKRIWHCESR